jgi:hypothetical protein
MTATRKTPSPGSALSIGFTLATAMTVVGLLASAPAHGQAYDWHWAFNHPPLFPTNEWGAVTNDCQLGLRVLKFQFESGEDIETAMIIRNVGDKHLDYTDWGEIADYDVVVKRGDGQPVAKTDWWAGFKPSGAFYRVVSVGLGPHEESLPLTGWLNVIRRYKMNAPGTYIITATQHVDLYEELPDIPHEYIPNKRYTRDSPLRFDLLSNPVTVTIVAPSVAKPEK